MEYTITINEAHKRACKAAYANCLLIVSEALSHVTYHHFDDADLKEFCGDVDKVTNVVNKWHKRFVDEAYSMKDLELQHKEERDEKRYG
ncbi:MAG: hypothetical protein GY861_19175 [bacterium]|nr:hypothetical protein [bacterium]